MTDLKNNILDKLKNEFEGKEIMSDELIESVQKKKLKIMSDIVIFADMILFCHSTLNLNLHKCSNKKLVSHLTTYLESIKLDEIRRLFSQISESELGQYYNKINLEKEIEKNKKCYEDLIKNFFYIFEETD